MEKFSPASCVTTSDLPPLPARETSPVLVMFSGGSDSTLTASLLTEKHSVVHLVTYHHRAMGFAAKSVTSST
jgi:tRNA(Ile)-lysidine synthase TilS/MesJ